MVVTRAAQAGTIGGGHLEYEALRIAREALARRGAARHVAGALSARRAVGQCCGGVATLAFAVVDRDARGWLDAARACARAGSRSRIVAPVGSGAARAARLVVSRDDARGTLGDDALDSAAIASCARARRGRARRTLAMPVPGRDAALLVQVERPRPVPVLLFGNGHVGAGAGAGARRAADAGALDRRARRGLPAAVPANVKVVATDVPEAELRAAPAGAFVS